MKPKFRGEKGQFSIIAALLITIIMVSALILTYAAVRNPPIRESPKVLGSQEEINLTFKRLLQFAVGYYGSVMQVTGNVTYAKELISNYFQSGLLYIAHSHPEWNPSFKINYLDLSTRWYEITSYSKGNLSVTYSLAGIGISNVIYTASSFFKIEVLETVGGYAKVLVTQEENTPDLTLQKENFFFYNFSNSGWKLVNPDSAPTVFSNGTYVVPIPYGVDQTSYLLKVSNNQGIMATAFFSTSKQPKYTYTFTWNSALYSSLSGDTIVVESLQNGTLRWLGQNLQLSTQGKPIPPIPVRALRINQTISGISREVPFQVEDWGSNYMVPLGLTSNASLFGDRQMMVFLVNHNVQNVTLWWDGRDTITQTPYAFVNRYFTGDDPASRRLTNGILTITISSSGFSITSSITGGGITSTTDFMRINNEDPAYGSSASYVIHHGIVRDILQQEAEWSSGAPNSPNVYSQMYFTLPANATYYTYALRTIFVDSLQARTLTDLSAIQLSCDWMAGARSLTENGTNVGFPIIGETFGGQNRLFYNFSSPSTGWAHHWSESISGSTGAGMMFTDSANRKLYAFDSIANQKTGALNVNVEQRTAWITPTAVYDRCGQDGGNPASSAIDEPTDPTPDTYWRHSTTENHWIILDMGQTIDISRIQIYQSSTASYRWGQSSGIEVYVSNNPGSWGSAVWTGTLDASGWRQTGAFSATGRYVRLRSLSTSSSQRLYEVQVQTQEMRVTIEYNPVERYSASFTYPLDVTWHGAVVSFNNLNNQPIYPTSGNIGLWIIVENPPLIAVS